VVKRICSTSWPQRLDPITTIEYTVSSSPEENAAFGQTLRMRALMPTRKTRRATAWKKRAGIVGVSE
jgi:hypothetical protein